MHCLAQITDAARAAEETITQASLRSDAAWLATVVVVFVFLIIGGVLWFLRIDNNGETERHLKVHELNASTNERYSKAMEQIGDVLMRMERNDEHIKSAMGHLIAAGREQVSGHPERVTAELDKASAKLG